MKKLYILTEITNGRVSLAMPYTLLDKAIKAAMDILKDVTYVKDIDWEYKWHYVFETGSSTLQICTAPLDDEDDALHLDFKML